MAEHDVDEDLVNAPITMRRIYKWGGIAAAILGAGFTGHQLLAGHLKFNLVSKASGGELGEQIKGVADAANKAADAASKVAVALDKHIKTEDLKEQKRALELLNARLQDIQLWESTNKPNAVSTRTRQDTLAQIEAQKEYIACLQAGMPNCVK